MSSHEEPKPGARAPMPAHRYRAFPTLDLKDRRWPDRRIERAPIWCSVDLRDGNQALVEPMGAERKLRLFRGLVAMGFKEIEVGFPAASQTEFDFVRRLIEQDLIPDDVTIQVLTQARDELIDRTVEAIQGARRAIVHVYNSTSTLQRRVVFRAERPEIVTIAVRGVERVKALVEGMPGTEVVLEYSPESFTGTESDFALEICEAVLDAWGASPERPVILNLPATVEMSTPNVYADQIELFCRGLSRRDSVVVSVHPHNDRGCAVAAAELAVMAGADRVEGTLFGNGERTGNVDVVTLALNLMTQGVDPGLDFSDMQSLVELAEYCTSLPVHPRHPYAGSLVFTAFSGSHQDAIRKGLAALEGSPGPSWEVPYLPLDPADVGRSYEAVIRINSQSGKGGLAYVMERDHGFALPRPLQVEFSRQIQALADVEGGELSADEIGQVFEREYLDTSGLHRLVDFSLERGRGEESECEVAGAVAIGSGSHSFRAAGTGPLDAFVKGFSQAVGIPIEVRGYWEHALGEGADARAVAYVEAEISGMRIFGVATHVSILAASLEAVVCAANRAVRAVASGVGEMSSPRIARPAAAGGSAVSETGEPGEVTDSVARIQEVEGGEDLAVDLRSGARSRS